MPQTDGKLLMIPGPCEFHEDVLKIVGSASPSHVAPSFEHYGGENPTDNYDPQLYRGIWSNPCTGQPFVIAGSGSLGWDFVSANLLEPGEKALVCNTGYFSDSWATCIKAYRGQVVNLQMPVGDCVDPAMLEAALKKEKYKIICLTQVDTSTGVKNDIKGLAAICKKIQPDALITVDGVCAFAAEELCFDDWGVDAALTGSQKALGVPPGLMAYEERKASYFATPAVTLVRGLYVACKKMLDIGMDKVFDLHLKNSLAFKAAMYSMGLTLVANEKK
eukprot:1152555-Amorphochlora_amoeboformis.AAC.1